MFKRGTSLILVALLSAVVCAAESEPGLFVKFYDLDGRTHQMPELAQDQLPNVVKIMPTLDLRTDRGDFKPFADNFYVEVEGFLTVEKAGEYAFRLMSDDGSMLWIDDQLVINNDGLHSGEPKDGRTQLVVGLHELSVKYFEAGGDERLELQWRPTGANGDFASIPPTAFTHNKAAAREIAPGKKRMISPLHRGLPGDGTPVAGMHPGFELLYQGTGILHTTPGTLADLPYEDLQIIVTSVGRPAMQPLARLFRRVLNSEDSGKQDYLASAPLVWQFLDNDDTREVSVVPLKDRIYTGQHLVDWGGHDVQRLFVENVDDTYEGCFFRFSHFKRGAGFVVDSSEKVWTTWNADGSEIGNFKLNSAKTNAFEMLAVRALSNGFEIEFTKPLDKRCGWEPETYYVEQWPFDVAKQQTPHRDGIVYPVKSASVSPDRRKVFLEIENLKPSHVVYLRLLPPCYCEDGQRIWSTEAWYTLNAIPKDRLGDVLTPPAPEPQNILTAQEQAEGWKLLFDGKSGRGWHGYRKDSFPDGWQAKNGCLVRCGSAGDISTDGEYANFELKIEWRVSAAANSGIFYRVNEEFDWPFFSGPEYQVLDNAEHADGKNPKTSAASNYALNAPACAVTAPVGYFNQARIVVNGPHVEHWLNGEKVVEYELWTDEWKALVAGSKFNAWKNYGLMKKGHIVLQDHGDMVWFRNIKIRELPENENGGNKVTK